MLLQEMTPGSNTARNGETLICDIYAIQYIKEVAEEEEKEEEGYICIVEVQLRAATVGADSQGRVGSITKRKGIFTYFTFDK